VRGQVSGTQEEEEKAMHPSVGGRRPRVPPSKKKKQNGDGDRAKASSKEKREKKRGRKKRGTSK